MSELHFFSAAGNSFAVVDGFADALPENPAAAARAVCENALEPKLQGLLLVGPPRAHGDGRMLVYNRDGSRAEMCGNGLRCVAKLMYEHGHVRRDRLEIETDSGHRVVRAHVRDGVVEAGSVEMGAPELVEMRTVLLVEGERLEVSIVHMGNPHCVLFVEEGADVPIARFGPLLERHERFPAGINVHIGRPQGRVLELETWERGVGPSPSCGSGACAAAAAGIQLGLLVSPVWVKQAGGTLEVEWRRFGSALLTGPVERVEPRMSAAYEGASAWTSV